MKCGMICPSHAAQLPVLNGRKCSPSFHESSNISLNISYHILTIPTFFLFSGESFAEYQPFLNTEIYEKRTLVE